VWPQRLQVTGRTSVGIAGIDVSPSRAKDFESTRNFASLNTVIKTYVTNLQANHQQTHQQTYAGKTISKVSGKGESGKVYRPV
jgi:hypothetical protein